MQFIDISVPLSEDTHVYPGDAEIHFTPTRQIDKGNAYNLTALQLGSHAGTHIDAPLHFFPDGRAVDQLSLYTLIGSAWVCHFPETDRVTANMLAYAGIPFSIQRLLIRTRNSGLWRKRGFQKDFAYLEPDAAEWIAARGTKLVGFDYLSVERFGVRKAEAHLKLLGKGVIILEGLNLSRVEPGEYELICLPLRLKGADGAPARAVLVRDR